MIDEIRKKIDQKTKPLGSLGQLEDVSTQICLIQKTLSPNLCNPTILVFAGDHGLAKSGVSAYPSQVTAQMVLNFLNGGAAINVLCRQHGINLKVVDAGVDYDFKKDEKLINAKIAKGTQNSLETNAMSKKELHACFIKAEDIIESVYLANSNIVGFGEMGIGNTSSASLIMSTLCNIPIRDCVGRGTGLNDIQLDNKKTILNEVLQNHSPVVDAVDALVKFGGFEIAQICYAMLAAHKREMIIMVDGFIATAAYLCALTINPKIKRNAIFCHQSQENGHQLMLDYLKVKPLLNLRMRLGEGIACALAYPLIKSAVLFINEMASFDSAKISKSI